MDSFDLLTYIRQPELLQEKQLNVLKKVVDKYPLFQTSRLLYVKLLHQLNHIDFYDELKKTAISTSNRKVLFDLIKRVPELKHQTLSIIESTEKIEIPKEEVVKVEEKKEEQVAELNEIVLTSNLPENNQKQIFYKEKNRDEHKIQTPVETNDDAKQTKDSIHQPPYVRKEKKEETIEDLVKNHLVNAFVERDLLKVTEINPKEKEELKEEINEPKSFSDWLKNLSKTKSDESKGEIVNEEKSVNPDNEKTITKSEKPINKEIKRNIIDKIIADEPKISKLKTEKNFFSPGTKAKSGVVEDENLVSETLAKIYAMQGNFSKAIRAYEILSLLHLANFFLMSFIFFLKPILLLFLNILINLFVLNIHVLLLRILLLIILLLINLLLIVLVLKLSLFS